MKLRRNNPDPKKHIEDAVWKYIAERRPLKMLAIAASAIGIVGGFVSSVERPAQYIFNYTKYALGLPPDSADVVPERAAFVAAILLVENYENCGSESTKGISTKPSQDNFNQIEASMRAAGYVDASFSRVRRQIGDECRATISEIENSFAGYLESKTQSARAFFDLGQRISALQFATFRNEPSFVAKLDSEFRQAHRDSQSTVQFRIPSLKMANPSSYSDSDKYRAAVADEELALLKFLGASGKLDPSSTKYKLLR